MPKARLQTGQTVDGFLIGDFVYKGGMATLWKVTKAGCDLPLLMKVPVMTEGEDPAAIVGFEMEQMILPRLSGQHVPKFIAAGDFAVQPYIVMEHVEAPSLLPKLDHLPLAWVDVVALGAKIAVALHDLHTQHVVHLDLKPSNVLCRANGEVVLVDYGLSHHDQLPDLMVEEFRLPYGTAPYMAPEQVMGVRHEPRSDQFALGVLMYFFATGTRPFGDPQRLKGLKRRIWQDPVPPRKLNPDIPPWFQEIILRCLEVNPSRRYPTASQLAFDLLHPEQVRLTGRATKLKQDPWTAVWKRRFNEDASPLQLSSIKQQISNAPIIMVAIDLSEGAEPVHDKLRQMTEQVLATMPQARVACINVLKQNRVTLDTTLDENGESKHVNRLVGLKNWANALGLSNGKVTFHVLEAVNPADAILEYAQNISADHILMGARTNSTLRSLLGSVSGVVAAQAPCTVTVVRAQNSKPAFAGGEQNAGLG